MMIDDYLISHYSIVVAEELCKIRMKRRQNVLLKRSCKSAS